MTECITKRPTAMVGFDHTQASRTRHRFRSSEGVNRVCGRFLLIMRDSTANPSALTNTKVPTDTMV